MVKKTDKTGFLFIFYFSEVGYPGSYRGGRRWRERKGGGVKLGSWVGGGTGQIGKLGNKGKRRKKRVGRAGRGGSEKEEGRGGKGKKLYG